MARIELPAGSLFAGEYRVIRRLSAGGMGAVYVVEERRSGQERALKIMHPELLGDKRLRERFLQESGVRARVASEHVVRVIDAGVDDATSMPWIAMELLQGADLGAVLAARGPLPPADAAEIFAQLCEAAAAAHDAGVVHRDLKPQNVFLSTPGPRGATHLVKVLDFGIAKLIAEADAPTAAIGTPTWMAPEQFEPGRLISPAADVWALGLIAYALLTGQPYWRAARTRGQTPFAVLREIAFEPLGPPRDRAAEIGAAHLLPPGFDEWFARCVAIAIDARFPDARAAHRAFDEVIPPAQSPGG